MGILIDKLRISGFRGLNDFEINLSKTTVLTGTNNVGKTTILKALQLALGSRSFLTVDDLYVDATFQAPNELSVLNHRQATYPFYSVSILLMQSKCLNHSPHIGLSKLLSFLLHLSIFLPLITALLLTAYIRNGT